ncbi:MAG: copper amine oxidase N-terminal domain-containing protein [Filifactor alocis]|nr:copper amine oxidase N-terminal domain-containing protein [Filifactor alocis]
MKKTIIGILCATMVALTGVTAFAETTHFSVPVKLINAYQKDKPSMANKALRSEADVVVDESGTTISIYLKPLEFGGTEENLKKMFLVENGKKIEGTKSETGEKPYNVKVELKSSAQKPAGLEAAVWVDAMDKIKGGGDGSGEQKVFLALDWSKSTEVKEGEKKEDVTPAPAVPEKKEDVTPAPAVPEKKETVKVEVPKSGIGVQINGALVNFDTPPVSKGGRTLVPLRAIFEALNAQVKWDAATKKITAVKEGRTVVLTLNKKQATISENGKTKTVELDVPAGLEQGGRTYVPLRFIGEAFGNKVSFEKKGKGSLIVIE